MLTSRIGEGLVSTEVGSKSDLLKIFGGHDDSNYREFHTAESFLKYSNNLKMVRVVNRQVTNRRLNFVDNTAPTNSEVSNFYNSEIADLTTVATTGSRLTFIEKFPNQGEDLTLAICSTESAWNQEISNEKLNLVVSKTVNNPPEFSLNNDMYLVPVGAVEEWAGHEGQYAIWLTENSSWNFVSVLSHDTIFVADENKEYRYIDSSWVEQDSYYVKFNHIKYKNESAYRVVYDESLQNSFGRIARFNQLFIDKPDFANGGICFVVLRKVSDDFRGDYFQMVEKFNTTYSRLSEVNSKSKFIWVKVGTANQNQISTTNRSVIENRFVSGTNTNLQPTEDDFKYVVGLLNDDPEVMMISDFQYGGQMNLVSSELNELSSEKILISGCYDNSRYSTVESIRDDFGHDVTRTYYNITNYDKCSVWASMGFSEDFGKFVPWFGDVAGQVIQNLQRKVLTAAGYCNGVLKNRRRSQVKFNNSDNMLLSQSKINTIILDDGSAVITNDLMFDSSMNLSYTLLFDVVKADVTKFFTDYNIKCPRIVEQEKLKNILTNRIDSYGVQSDITYSTVDDEIRFVVKLYYKNIVKEIIVNFTIS